MRREWEDDAAAQVRLGVTWERAARAVERATDRVARRAADRLRRHVLEPFLATADPGVQEAVRRHVDEGGSAAERPTVRGTLSAPPDPRVLAVRWVRQGRLLAVERGIWDELRAWHADRPAGARAGELRQLRDEVEAFEHQLADRRRPDWRTGGIRVEGVGHEDDLLGQARRLLGRAALLLAGVEARLDAADPEVPVDRLDEARRQALDDLPGGWPPAVLVGWAGEDRGRLDRAAEEAGGCDPVGDLADRLGSAADPDKTARVLLVRAAFRADPGDGFADLARRLLPVDLAAEVVTDPTAAAAVALPVEVADVDAPTLTGPGLVVRPAGRPAVDCRTARRLVPPDLPPGVAPLRDLGRAGEGGGAGWADVARAGFDLAEAVRQADGLGAWLAAETADGRVGRAGELWWLVQRAGGCADDLPPGPRARVRAALDQLEGCGLWTARELPAGVPEPAGDGVWLLTPPGGPPAPPSSGPYLRLPDGRWLGRAMWWRPVGPGSAGPLAEAVARLGPLLAELGRIDHEWDDWPGVHILVGAAAETADRAGAVEVAGGLFAAVYARAEGLRAADPVGPRAVAVTAVGRALLRLLRDDLGATVRPALDAETFRPCPLDEKTAAATDVSWVPDRGPLGTVLSVRRFAVGDGGRPAVEASGGAVPAAADGWLGADPPADCPPLAGWVSDLPHLLWHPDRLADRRADARRALGDWLRTPAGADWFDARAREWAPGGVLPRLVAGGWCEVWPTAAADGGAWWPMADARPAGVRLVADPGGAAAGRVVGRVRRYSPWPAGAGCEVSVGPADPGSPLGRAVELGAAVGAVPGAADGPLGGAAAEVGWDEYARARGEPAADPADRAGLLLDGLVAAADGLGREDDGSPARANHRRLPPAAAAGLDRAFAAVAGWLAAHRLEVVPADPPFARPPAAAALSADDRVAVYRDAVPAGEVVQVAQLGFRGPGGVGRPARVRVSAGNTPPYFPELLATVRAIPAPPARHWLAALRGWPAASLDGRLADQAVGLFVTMYGPDGGPVREAHPELFQAVADALAGLLAGEFRYYPFEPRLVLDFPERWVQVLNPGGMATGVVRAVHRPGLRTESNQLIAPALVTVD